MENFNVMEKLEEKIVFRISRLFFLTLAIISMVTIIWGIAYVFSASTPPEPLQEPKPVVVQSFDIQDAINQANMSETSNSPSSSEQSKESNQPENIRFDKYIKTLKLLLPESKYSWQEKGFYTGNYYNQRYVVSDIGITRRLNAFVKNFDGQKEYNDALSQLCVALEKFPGDQRLIPLTTFLALYVEQLKKYEESKRILKEEYQESIAAKKNARYVGLIVVGSALSSMAFLGIFLVLLSIQRNIKRFIN